MATDDKDSSPNKKAGADSRAVASAPLLGSYIKDTEGGSPKENPFTVVSASVEAITAGVVYADASE